MASPQLEQQAQQQDSDEELDPTHVIWERKRYYCCFGWRRPLCHSGWVDSTGSNLADRPHPGTREYKLAQEGRNKGKDWEYKILVNEHTDSEGWQFARCLWGQLGKPRPQGRHVERYPDFVRHRQWVHKDHADEVLRSAKRGAVGVLDPVQLARKEQAAQSRYEEGLKSVQELVAQLEENNKLKSMAYSLLDPVAVFRVARNHIRVLRGLQAKALRELKPVTMTSTEVFLDDVQEGPGRSSRSLSQLPPAARQAEGSQAVWVAQSAIDPFMVTDSVIAAGGMPSMLTARFAPGNVIMEGSTPAGSVMPVSSRPGSLNQGSQIQPVGSGAGSMGLGGSAQAATAPVFGAHANGQLPGSMGQGAVHGSTLQSGSVVQRAHGRGISGSSIWNSIIQRRARPGSAPQAELSSTSRHGMQPGEQSIPRLVSGKGWRRFPWPRRQRPRPALPGQPHRMILSMPELECATGHALAIYGDIEEYLNAYPRQSYYDAIAKFTGVPQEDVLMAMWRSRPFKPAHYVAVDHRHKKIVVCIRGTFDKYDRITDLVCQPVLHTFGPGLQGFVHHGVLRASLNIVKRLMEVLQDAVARCPEYDVLVTGHSLGGGTASILAMLLRYHEVLPERQRRRLRCVALAPLPAMGTHLARSCQDYVASVIYNWDLAPRLNIHNMAKYLAQVTQASPLRRAIVGVSHAMSKLSDMVHLHKHDKDDDDKSGSNDVAGAHPEQAPFTDTVTNPAAGGDKTSGRGGGGSSKPDGASPVLSAEGASKDTPSPASIPQQAPAGTTPALHIAQPGVVSQQAARPGVGMQQTVRPGASAMPTGTGLLATPTTVPSGLLGTHAGGLGTGMSPAAASNEQTMQLAGILDRHDDQANVLPSGAATQWGGVGQPQSMPTVHPCAIPDGNSVAAVAANGVHEGQMQPAKTRASHSFGRVHGRQETGALAAEPAGHQQRGRQSSELAPSLHGQQPAPVGSMSRQQLHEQEMELRHAIAALQDLLPAKQAVQTAGSPAVHRSGAMPASDEADATATVAMAGRRGQQPEQTLTPSQVEGQAAYKASELLTTALQHLQQLQALQAQGPEQSTAQQWLRGESPKVPPWQQEQDWRKQITWHEQQFAKDLNAALFTMQEAVPARQAESEVSTDDDNSDTDMDSDNAPQVQRMQHTTADVGVHRTRGTHTASISGAPTGNSHQPLQRTVAMQPVAHQPVTVVYKSVTYVHNGGEERSTRPSGQGHDTAEADPVSAAATHEPADAGPKCTTCAEAAAATHPESGSAALHPDHGSTCPVAAAAADVRGAADAADDENDQPSAVTAAADEPLEPNKRFEGAEGTSSDSKVLLQPLEPPGTVFWLVRDTRVKHKRMKLAMGGVLKGLVNFMSTGETPPPDAMAPAQPVSSKNRGSFLAGLAPGLESTEEEADTPEPGNGKKGSSKSKELPVVLLAADATWFSEMWVSMKAISDHGPVNYWQAINQLFEQQRHKGLD